MTDKIDVAREAMAHTIFADWAEKNVADLARLMRRFADAVSAGALKAELMDHSFRKD